MEYVAVILVLALLFGCVAHNVSILMQLGEVQRELQQARLQLEDCQCQAPPLLLPQQPSRTGIVRRILSAVTLRQ